MLWGEGGAVNWLCQFLTLTLGRFLNLLPLRRRNFSIQGNQPTSGALEWGMNKVFRKFLWSPKGYPKGNTNPFNPRAWWVRLDPRKIKSKDGGLESLVLAGAILDSVPHPRARELPRKWENQVTIWFPGAGPSQPEKTVTSSDPPNLQNPKSSIIRSSLPEG